MAKSIYGANEWGVDGKISCFGGCRNDCRYCYSKNRETKRFKRIEDWAKMKVRPADVYRVRKFLGTVMFPTNHDLVPEVFAECRIVLQYLLAAGNTVILVSKPHFQCIKPLVDTLGAYKERLIFRFTIGCTSQTLLNYWEPAAPSLSERIRCLRYAFEHGYRTSVSAEPVLDWDHLDDLVEKLAPITNESLWIGMMNFRSYFPTIKTNEDKLMHDSIKKGHTKEQLQSVFNRHKGNPLIRWKSSIAKILGIDACGKKVEGTV